MSYRRRETDDAGLADLLSKTEELAAVSLIRFVRRHLVSLVMERATSRVPQEAGRRERCCSGSRV
jgi:hypothetical protein